MQFKFQIFLPFTDSSHHRCHISVGLRSGSPRASRTAPAGFKMAHIHPSHMGGIVEKSRGADVAPSPSIDTVPVFCTVEHVRVPANLIVYQPHHPSSLPSQISCGRWSSGPQLAQSSKGGTPQSQSHPIQTGLYAQSPSQSQSSQTGLSRQFTCSLKSQ